MYGWLMLTIAAPMIPSVDWQTIRVLCLGLDGAGKTSICQSASSSTLSSPHEPPEPTIGFRTRTVKCEPHWKLQLWDIGGGEQLRQYWTRYVKGSEEGIIWVIDAADSARFEESRQGALP
jgi:GTPase SAR1 family protein